MLSEFPFLYRFTVLLNSGGSNSRWSEFWSEFPHFMGMGVVPAPSIFSIILLLPLQFWLCYYMFLIQLITAGMNN